MVRLRMSKFASTLVKSYIVDQLHSLSEYRLSYLVLEPDSYKTVKCFSWDIFGCGNMNGNGSSEKCSETTEGQHVDE